MNFRVKFKALDAVRSKEICSHMITRSDPIKIISKPEKPSKRTRVNNKKTTSNDEILDSLEKISKGLQENLNAMSAVLKQLNPSATVPAFGTALLSNSTGPNDSNQYSFPSSSTFQPPYLDDHGSFLSSLTNVEPPTKKQKIDDDRPLDFETSFKDMMKAFENVKADARASQMERFVRTHRISVTELSELHDMLSDGGLGQPIGNPYSQNAMFGATQDCNCENCPFKKEVETRDDFLEGLFNFQ